MTARPRYTVPNPSGKEAVVADIIYLERNDPVAKYAKAFQDVGMVLSELASAIQLLRDFRARLHQGELGADIPWDVLESVIQDLSSALQELHHSIRGLEETLSSLPWGERPAG
jgi:hypothetical protein